MKTKPCPNCHQYRWMNPKSSMIIVGGIFLLFPIPFVLILISIFLMPTMPIEVLITLSFLIGAAGIIYGNRIKNKGLLTCMNCGLKIEADELENSKEN